MKLYAQRRLGGFTMIELLSVMAILGILAVAVIPLGETLIVAQKERDLKKALSEIRNALDEHKRAVDRGMIAVGPTTSGYPSTLDVLADGIPDARPESKGRPIYFLRAIPRDPFADPQLPASQTWKLRSYASPASRPEPGADVFDVHSKSDKAALDGSRYSQW